MKIQIFTVLTAALISSLAAADPQPDQADEPSLIDSAPEACRVLTPISKQHCDKAVRIINKKASVLDTDANFQDKVEKACADGADGLDSSVIESCKKAVTNQLAIELSCENKSLFMGLTARGRACKAGYKAVKAYKLDPKMGYSEAKAGMTKAAADACPKWNHFISEACLRRATATMEDRIGNCSDHPLHIEAPSSSTYKASRNLIDGIPCFPRTYEVTAGNGYNVKVNSNNVTASIERVERLDGTVFKPEFSPPQRTPMFNAVIPQSTTYPQCQELIFERDEITCVGHDGYVGKSSVVGRAHVTEPDDGGEVKEVIEAK